MKLVVNNEDTEQTPYDVLSKLFGPELCSGLVGAPAQLEVVEEE